jgi:hypothetical protein
LREDKKMEGNMFKKGLVVGIIFLFVGVGFQHAFANEISIKSTSGNTKEQIYFFNNPPIVEIINPKNGSIVYNSSVNISIEYSDDNGIEKYRMMYGGYNYSGGHGGGWSEPIKYYIFNKTITVTPGYNLIFATAYDEEGNVGHDFSIYYYYSNNPIPNGTPPKVEILIPENGSVVYDKNASMCVKCTDDDGIVSVRSTYCGRTGGGGRSAIPTEPQLEYYLNHTIRAKIGYNWIMAWAYDVNNSIGYNITLYRYDEMKTSFIIGLITDKEENGNYTTFKAKALLYLGYQPFTFNIYQSGEEIIISNCYSGYVGLHFIIGRFNSAMITQCTPTSIQPLFNGLKRGT